MADSQPSMPQQLRTPSTPATPATPFPATDDGLGNPTASASHAGPSTPSRTTPSRPGPSSTPCATAAGGGGGGSEDSGGEDEMPDYLRLAALTAKASKGGSGAGSKPRSGPAETVVIPKRGEKDFEPTGFGGQSKLLERSREAMISAISGERRTIQKSLVTASWDAELGRAVVHELQGKLFETTGQISKRQVRIDVDGDEGSKERSPKYKTVSRDELFPEEALFMLERGSLILFARPPPSSTSNGGSGKVNDDDKDAWKAQRVEPMSLQQAFAALVGDTTGLTRERYQIYVYLKRLGYVVQRATDVDRIRSEKPPPSSAERRRKKAATTAATAGATSSTSADGDKEKEAVVGEKGILADPKRPLKLVNDLDLLLYVPRRIWQLMGGATRWLVSWIRRVSAQLTSIASRVVSKLVGGTRSPVTGELSSTSLLGLGTGGGRRRGLLGTPKWDSYNSVYETLQIVPSGHERPFPATRAAKHSAEVDLMPFYYAWRPATSYRKTHPPPPEFRIAIIDADKQPVPSAWEFEEMFGAVPLPGSLEELGLESSSITAAATLASSANNAGSSSSSNSVIGREKDGSSSLEDEEWTQRLRYEQYLKRLTEEANKRAYGKSSEGRLKKTVVLAVVQSGITTLLRFGEAEFDRYRLAGKDRTEGNAIL